MEDEEKKDEKEEKKDDLSNIIRQARELIEEQKKTIEAQHAKIDELQKDRIEKQEEAKETKEIEKQEEAKETKEIESVSDMLKDFKKDITEMLQWYNRNNPIEKNDTSFEDSQMDILKRRF